MISVVIPFKDNVHLLEKCVASILQKTSYFDYELILVDNDSKKKKTFEYLKSLKNNSKISVLQYEWLFNFSAINNFAVMHAKGEYLLFLNNDTEVISENWLEEMLKCFEDEKVGAVGAKLLYQNGKIQHIGVEMHPKHGPVHTSRLASEKDIDFSQSRECIAVTAACMMTRKILFNKIGGFDEQNLPIAYNDVNYCLKLREKGYKIICTPFAKLYHHESASRGSDIRKKLFDNNRYKEFLKERVYMKKKWKKYFKNDEYHANSFVEKSFLREILTKFFK